MEGANRYLGVDFSGAAAPWRERVRIPTVWVAELQLGMGRLPAVESLRPVQDLPGPGDGFERLLRRLAVPDYEAAGIDAPFSIPLDHIGEGGWAGLVAAVRDLPDAADRAFPRGRQLIELAERIRLKQRPKPLRVCEDLWTRRGVNTRSTLWQQPRGGAPFAAACLALIARSGRPCWPWSTASNGCLVEAFPAAQLARWGLPTQGYNGTVGEAVRRTILAALANRVDFTREHEAAMLGSADALDAVLAGFGAIGAATGQLAYPADGGDEGWIAVHC